MGVLFNLSPVAVYKNSGVFQASAKKRFEPILGDQSNAVGVLLSPVLLSANIDSVLKERCVKKNLVSPLSSSGGKVVFTLLTEVVALHIRLFAIYAWKTSFQGFISRLFTGGESLSLQNNLKNVLQVFFGIFRDRKCSSRDNSNKKVSLGGPASWSDISLSNFGDGEKSRRATEGATEGAIKGATKRATRKATKRTTERATERRFRREQLWPWTEVILVQIFF